VYSSPDRLIPRNSIGCSVFNCTIRLPAVASQGKLPESSAAMNSNIAGICGPVNGSLDKAHLPVPRSLAPPDRGTPGHVDITNPVNGRGILINQRDVVQLSASGAVQVTPTNTYSGNNGRNVILGSNGNYYIVGNAGNDGKSVSLKSGTVTLTSGSTNVSLSGASTTANLYVGAPFSGTSVPVGAYITGIMDSTHFTISAAATGLASGAYTANAGGYFSLPTHQLAGQLID
jgi:hypothetical protein